MKMWVLDQSHTEASDDCQVLIEEQSLGVILVVAVPDALTHLVITSGKKAGF